MFGQKNKMIKLLQVEIQAVRHQVDVLMLPVTASNKRIRKNNYMTYASQVEAIKEKYNANADYGNAMTGTIIDTRTAFICGQGINIVSDDEATGEWVKKFLDDNDLNGTKLISMVQESEMEGKQLIVLKPTKEQVEVKLFSWTTNKYTVNTAKDDYEKIKSVTYKTDDGDTHKVEIDRAVYVKVGGSDNCINDTPPRIASVLTQIDNYERALYDLREGNHLFGYPTPCFLTTSDQQSTTIQKAIDKNAWKVGQTYVGTAKMYYPAPPDVYSGLDKEMSLNIKLISSRTGLPVHWLGWTDLMSNRATATELRDFVVAGTMKERLIWTEKITEMIQKAMTLAKDSSIDGAVYDPDGFTVTLPYITLEQVKALSETWLPLKENNVISMGTYRNMIPGIEPDEEARKIQEEKDSSKVDIEKSLLIDKSKVIDKQGEDDE